MNELCLDSLPLQRSGGRLLLMKGTKEALHFFSAHGFYLIRCSSKVPAHGSVSAGAQIAGKFLTMLTSFPRRKVLATEKAALLRTNFCCRNFRGRGHARQHTRMQRSYEQLEIGEKKWLRRLMTRCMPCFTTNSNFPLQKKVTFNKELKK